MTSESKSFYHFTHFDHAHDILTSGALMPSESNVGAPYEVPYGPVGLGAAPPVVWLLDNPEPEWPHEMANGLYPEKRRVRFEVKVKAIKWSEWFPARVMNPDWRYAFENSAGGAEGWYVWPNPISAKRWVSVLDTETGTSFDITPG